MFFPPLLLPLSSAGSQGLELEKFGKEKNESQDQASGGVAGREKMVNTAVRIFV